MAHRLMSDPQFGKALFAFASHRHRPGFRIERKEAVQELQPLFPLPFGGCAVAQASPVAIPGVPGYRIPEDYFVGIDAEINQRPPDDRRGGFAHSVPVHLAPARSNGFPPSEYMIRPYSVLFLLMPKKDSFRSHGNTGQMPPLVAHGLGNKKQFRLTQPLFQIGPELFP